MQESTIKSNFTFMRLLCGLLLFSIIDCCLYSCRNLKPCISLSCRGHSVFCFSGLTVAFLHSSKLFFLPLFKAIPTKLTHFRLIFQNFFSFKIWFINKFQVIEFKPRDNLEFTPWHLDWWIIRVWRSLSKSLWQHNGATNLAF